MRQVREPKQQILESLDDLKPQKNYIGAQKLRSLAKVKPG